MREQFVREDELTGATITAARPWRRDSDGRWWFVIRAIKAQATDADDDDDDSGVDEYRAHCESERAQATKQYREMIDARARGENIDPAEGQRILSAAGVTMDEFNEAVFAHAENLIELGEI